jgi:hypothetical protein
VVDLIIQEFVPEERIKLYTDCAVCICMLRIALTPLEQQLVLKLLYMPDESPGVTPKSFATRFLNSGKPSDLDLSRSFFKKLD